MKASTVLQGAGVSALVLFPFYRSMLDMPSDVRMHMPVSVTPVTFALIANLVLVSIIFALVGTWLQSTSRWTWWKLFLPALILASLAEMIHMAHRGWESTTIWVVVLAVILSLTIVLHWLWPKGEKMLLQLSGATLIGLGFFCIFAVFQLLHMAMWHQSPNFISKTVPAKTIRSDRPRVVWILFDELSYDQVFGHRYPNLLLPNFDKFRQSSTVFTDVEPVVNETERAVPSLLLGQRVNRVKYTFGNQLKVGIGRGALHPFDAAQTPFALARHDGLTTGVVGWYNPYCGMLAPYLSQCYWTDVLPESRRPSEKTFWHNFFRPWAFYDMIFRHPERLLTRNNRAWVIEDLMQLPTDVMIEVPDNRVRVYRDLMRRSEHMLEPSGPDFVFLHLPLPHPLGFYNRKTQQFDTSGQRSYIDNLALTDKTLGQLLGILKQSPRWKNTSVVICGDHSWRVYMWAHEQYWTAEDQAASHGAVFDPRPLLIVHLAGQTTAATVNAPFPLLGVHTILDNLVQGRQPSFLTNGH